MSISEYIARLRGGIAQIEANRAKDALTLGSGLSALIWLRIDTSGLDADGQAFTPYSPAYARRRRAKGRQVGFVDFSDTGQLRDATRAVLVDSAPGVARVAITAVGADALRKARAALTQPKAAPRGNIFRPSASELATAQSANQRRVLRYIPLNT
jgi:hypothetical protein